MHEAIKSFFQNKEKDNPALASLLNFLDYLVSHRFIDPQNKTDIEGKKKELSFVLKDFGDTIIIKFNAKSKMYIYSFNFGNDKNNINTYLAQNQWSRYGSTNVIKLDNFWIINESQLSDVKTILDITLGLDTGNVRQDTTSKKTEQEKSPREYSEPEIFGKNALQEPKVIKKNFAESITTKSLAIDWGAVFSEGEKYATEVNRFTRNSKIVNALKQERENKCGICSFSFTDFYGADCNYIEAHHLEPLANTNGRKEVTEADFILLCANCHRALHHIYKQDCAPHHVDELRKKIEAKRLHDSNNPNT